MDAGGGEGVCGVGDVGAGGAGGGAADRGVEVCVAAEVEVCGGCEFGCCDEDAGVVIGADDRFGVPGDDAGLIGAGCSSAVAELQLAVVVSGEGGGVESCCGGPAVGVDGGGAVGFDVGGVGGVDGAAGDPDGCAAGDTDLDAGGDVAEVDQPVLRWVEYGAAYFDPVAPGL